MKPTATRVLDRIAEAGDPGGPGREKIVGNFHLDLFSKVGNGGAVAKCHGGSRPGRKFCVRSWAPPAPFAQLIIKKRFAQEFSRKPPEFRRGPIKGAGAGATPCPGKPP
jgi:hypothetical protein